jgi:hypothetical protein
LVNKAGDASEDELSCEAIKVLLLHLSGALSAHALLAQVVDSNNNQQRLPIHPATQKLGATAAPLFGLLLPVWLACLQQPGISQAVLKPLVLRSVVHAAQQAPHLFRTSLVALAPPQQEALKAAMQAHMQSSAAAAAAPSGSGGGGGAGAGGRGGSAPAAPPSLKTIDMSKYGKK